MKTPHRIFLLLLLAPICVQASDRVVARTKRMNMLKETRQYMNLADPELKAEISEVRYPFEFKPEEVAAPVKVVDNKPVEVAPVEISNQEILDKIAPNIKPTGVLFKGGKGVLILPKGQLADGSAIRVNYADKPYIIRVTDVTTDSFTLRLDDASLVRQIDAGSGRGVTRDK